MPFKYKPLLALLSSLLVSGCVTTGGGDYEQLKQAVDRAQRVAEHAMRQAAAAEMKANEAIELANRVTEKHDDPMMDASTRDIAQRALKVANEAKQEADKANKRAERMYKKAVSR